MLQLRAAAAADQADDAADAALRAAPSAAAAAAFVSPAAALIAVEELSPQVRNHAEGTAPKEILR